MKLLQEENTCYRMKIHGWKNELTQPKLTKSIQNCHKITKTCIQLPQSSLNFFLTCIWLVKLLQDGHKLRKENLKRSKLMKYAKNGHKINKIWMQPAQTCMNLFLTRIKPVKLLRDKHIWLKEWVDTYKTDKIDLEWSQND